MILEDYIFVFIATTYFFFWVFCLIWLVPDLIKRQSVPKFLKPVWFLFMLTGLFGLFAYFLVYPSYDWRNLRREKGD